MIVATCQFLFHFALTYGRKVIDMKRKTILFLLFLALILFLFVIAVNALGLMVVINYISDFLGFEKEIDYLTAVMSVLFIGLLVEFVIDSIRHLRKKRCLENCKEKFDLL